VKSSNGRLGSRAGVEEQRVNVIVDFDDRHSAGKLGDGRVEVGVIIWERRRNEGADERCSRRRRRRLQSARKAAQTRFGSVSATPSKPN
jgi:hypothetical protein